MKFRTLEFLISLGAGLLASQTAYGQTTSLLTEGAKAAEAGEIINFAGKHPFMAVVGAGILGGGALAVDEYRVRQTAATDVGLALSTFGTPASESAVTSLAALIHEHPIIAPGAIDRSFAAEIEEH